MRAYFIILLMLALLACTKDASVSTTPYSFQLPNHFPAIQQPADNLATVEGVALGKLLFFDKNLSKQKNISCATCHILGQAFADNLPTSIGTNGTTAVRNTQPIFNMAFQPSYFWDGGVPNLESTGLVPLTGTHEMGNTLQAILQYLNANTQYVNAFQKIYAIKPISTSMLLKVLAQYQRTIISSNSKYDRYMNNTVTLSPIEMQGLQLFTDSLKGNCNTCHTLSNLSSNNMFYNVGMPLLPNDLGRYRITLHTADSGKFKTPTLRNLSYTAPYMHNGSISTLQEVLQFFNSGYIITPLIDSNITKLGKNRLSQAELNALEAFLLTLNDSSLITDSRYK